MLASYGLTPTQYDARVTLQGGRCAICQTIPQGGGRRGTLHVDHDHASGAVRGLLCVDCNLILGKSHDSPEQLRAAAAYLDQWAVAG